MAGKSYDEAPQVPTKGYDDSPPRNGVIFFYTVLTVVLLGAVDLLLDSYFAKVMDGEVHDKVLSRGLEQAVETRAKEHEALEKSGIEQAMRAVAQRGRSASPAIASESGAGKPQLSGWSQLKREVPPVAPAAEPAKATTPSAQDAQAQPDSAAPKGKSPAAPAARPAPTGGAR